jgi:hypothetical protein
MFIVHAFINYTITVAVWTSFSFHVRLMCAVDIRITRQDDQSASDHHPKRVNYSPAAILATFASNH